MQNTVRGLGRRIAMMCARAVLRATYDDKGVQEAQLDLLADETRTGAQRFQEYGMTSHPHPGAEVITLSLGGAREHMVVIAVDDRRYRLKALAQGEVALYDDRGAKVHLTRTGLELVDPVEVRISAPKIDLNAPLVIANGSPISRVGDNVNVGAGSSSGLWPLVEGADG